MQNNIRELIEALKYCAAGKPTCKGCPRYEDKADCITNLKLDAADALKQLLDVVYAKDIIIDDLNDKKNMLEKENNLLWKKHTPMAVEVRVMDEEFDIKTNHCPSCGVRFLNDTSLYCGECGQALRREDTSTDDDTEIGMITNVNDRM